MTSNGSTSLPPDIKIKDAAIPDMETAGYGLLIAVPSRGLTRIEWAINLRGLALPMGFTSAHRIVVGREVAEARNILALEAVNHEAEFLFFLDDDVLVPNHTIRRMVNLMQRNPEWDLLSGIYVTKLRDTPEPLIFGPKGTQHGTYWDWKFNTQFEISACGLGCSLIRVSAFEKIEQPWFKWTFTTNAQTSGEEGEDVHFCRRLREAGGKVMADGGVLCGHIDQDGVVYSLPVDTPPLKGADLSKAVVLSTGGKAH